MSEELAGIVSICSGIMTIITFLLFFIKPIREKLLGTKQTKEGQKCLLRSQMLEIYYANKKDKVLTQYQRENFDYLFNAYTALGGNSFIQDIYSEVRSWEISV